MLDGEAIKRNLEEWKQNPHWAAYYNDAPTDHGKAYVALHLYVSETGDEEADKAMDELEDKLSAEDWKHLLKYAGGTPFAKKCKQKIDELEA